jgi:hypothetical protein
MSGAKRCKDNVKIHKDGMTKKMRRKEYSLGDKMLMNSSR